MQVKQLNQKGVQLLAEYGFLAEGAEKIDIVVYNQREYFLQEGQPIDYLYFVLSGRAKVCLNAPNGKQLLLCYFISKGIVGDLELMTEQKLAFATMQAVTAFECIRLPLHLYGRVLKNNITFMNCLAKELAYKLKQSDMNGAITVLHPLEERLCAYIAQTSPDDKFRETLTDVAGLLGSSYRHLLRCLESLCKKGILSKSKTGYIILNRTLLEKHASELYIL